MKATITSLIFLLLSLTVSSQTYKKNQSAPITIQETAR